MRAYFICLKSGASMVIYSKKDLTLRPVLDKDDHFDIIWDDVSLVVDNVENTKKETNFNGEHKEMMSLNNISKYEANRHIQEAMEKKHPQNTIAPSGLALPGPGRM